MAEANELRNGEMEHASFQVAGIPGDLLQKFFAGNSFSRKLEEAQDEEEVELSLGLSLNGRFGFDPEKAKKLTRSSSISDFFLNPSRMNGEIGENSSGPRLPVSVPVAAPLGRTCSLPTETEETWRKRKEMQCLRRMEAKRKRTEKQRIFRAAAAAEAKDRFEDEKDCTKQNDALNAMLQEPQMQFPKVPKKFVSPERRSPVSNSVETKPEPANGGEGVLPPSSQGSTGSPGSGGSGSSWVSDFGSQVVQGMNSKPDARSPRSVQFIPEQNEQNPAAMAEIPSEKLGKFSTATNDTQCKKLMDAQNEVKVTAMKAGMDDMPCVSTTGDGPNGRRTEGFLYRYQKGEEVKILCVCHGSFLTPAEFVKHAGGGDVAHPLKHIVVSSTPFL